MLRFVLREDQWKRLKGLLPGKDSDPGRSAYDNRLFLEAILWKVREVVAEIRTSCPRRCAVARSAG